MVATNMDDLGILLAIVIIPPIILVGGIGLVLAGIGAPWWVVLIVSILNIAGVIYLLIKWELLQNLSEALQTFLNS